MEAKEVYKLHFGKDHFNEEGWNYIVEVRLDKSFVSDRVKYTVKYKYIYFQMAKYKYDKFQIVKYTNTVSITNTNFKTLIYFAIFVP